MIEKNEKDELQSRREFFRKTARTVLPAFAALALSAVPKVIKASEAESGCGRGTCSGTCSGSCRNNCQSTCKGSCSGSCKDKCQSTCLGACSGSCKNSCQSSNKR